MRLNSDGTVESSVTFNFGSGTNGLGSVVASFGVQADGKILIAGNFLTVNGLPRNSIARLHSDGTVESTATFNPGAVFPAGSISCIAIQADGRILAGGWFTTFDGQPRSGLARLTADGALEGTESFNASADASIYGMMEQSDGRILIWGTFLNVNGTSRPKVARLQADGTLDASFSPTALGTTPIVHCVLAQPDGKYLLGGSFLTGPSLNNFGVAKTTASGAAEGFSFPIPQPSGSARQWLLTAALQTDGKAVLGGGFDLPSGLGLSRRNVDGTVGKIATIISPNISNLALQHDGKIIIAGGFTKVNGQTREGIARLLNDAATQSLSIVGGSKVQWMRGGAGPEVMNVMFERSLNNGATWAPLGPGTQVSGGWELAVNLPSTATVRARGRTVSGYLNSNSGLVEQTLNIPEISVLDQAGAELADGMSSIDFGPVVSGSSGSRLLTIENPGTVDLENLAVSMAPGGNAGDFSVTQPASATLAPGASATFTVTFTPTAAGTRTATVQVASNDPDENPFDITVTGRQATASEAWRITYFGSPDNTGPGADLNDPDNDGIVNLVEFATNSHPQAFTPPIGELVKNGSTLEFNYTRPVAALAEVDYDLEASIALSGAWSKVGQAETILSDDGIFQQVKATYPAGITGKRFVRLRMTRR